jgi:transcriptional regulator with XRE-family HTH domain
MKRSFAVGDASSFGRRLRDLRRARGLSQSDLAGNELSPSYVSLLESDRRKPSAPLLDLLAKRLGVTPAELTGAADHDRTVTSFVEHFSLARQAWRDGDYPRAETLLRDAAAEGDAIGDTATWWTATRDLAELYGSEQQHESAYHLLCALANSPATKGSVWLGIDVRTTLAEVLRAMGRLQESLQEATAAVTLSRQLDRCPAERGRALLSLLAAQAECGDLTSAGQTGAELELIVDDLPSPRLRGAAHWALGNAAFLSGAVARAGTHHDKAFEFVSPKVDLRFWARLNRASATMRLLAGEATADVQLLLDGQRPHSN